VAARAASSHRQFRGKFESVLGLYVHVPFCSAICNYCNFNRGLFDDSLKRRFVGAVCSEIEHGIGNLPSEKNVRDTMLADTLYFGGGTPSLLDAAEVGQIVERCRDAFALTPDAEITLEANPESVDSTRLRQFREAGVNRLSFGVQSFRAEELQRLGRLHSVERAEEALSAARHAGFENVSLDLMMWLPNQTLADWEISVQRAIRLNPEHISLYMLEVYPHLPLRTEMDRSHWQQAPDDVAAEMYEMAMETLGIAGYDQYEISNVAKPGFRSRHNLKYWTDGEWIGFGPGAHSTAGNCRWRTVASTEDYVQRITAHRDSIAERRQLTVEERLGDAMFTGLRLNDGIRLTAMSARYGIDIWNRYGERLAEYLDAGLLRKDGDRIWLSRKGMLLAHEVMTVFV